MPHLSADQAETVLSRLREADYPRDDTLVAAAMKRLEEAGGKRRANAVEKWWGESGDKAERRARRQQNGTVKEQQSAYREYVRSLAAELEANTRGSAVTREQKGAQARGRGMSLERILTSSPDTMRKHLSSESLEWLAREHGGPPLSFDAWRHAYLGSRDTTAVTSWQRRTGGFFSEYG